MMTKPHGSVSRDPSSRPNQVLDLEQPFPFTVRSLRESPRLAPARRASVLVESALESPLTLDQITLV